MAAGLHLGACISVSSAYEQGVVNRTLNSPVQANLPSARALQPMLIDAPVQGRKDWWINFEDGTLNELITYAMGNASTIKEAVNRIDRAEAAYLQVSRNHKPTLQGQASISAQFPELNNEFGDAEPIFDGAGNIIGSSDAAIFTEVELGPTISRSGVFQLSWTPDLYGALKATRMAGEADLFASHQALENAQRLIIGQIAIQYMNLRSAQTTIAFQGLRLEQQREHLKVLTYLLEEGFATSFDVRALESQVGQSELQISSAQTSATSAINTMFALAGANDLQRFSARMWREQALPTLPMIPQQIDPVALINARPDLQAAEFSLRAAAERVFAAKTTLLPSITPSGTLSLDPFELIRSDLFDAFGLSIAGSLTQTLLNRTALRAAVMVQDNNLKAAALTYEQTVRQIVADVDRTLAARYAAEQQFNALKGQRDMNATNFEETLVLFDEGLAERSRVFNAQISHLDSISQQYRAYFGVLQAHIELMTNTVY